MLRLPSRPVILRKLATKSQHSMPIFSLASAPAPHLPLDLGALGLADPPPPHADLDTTSATPPLQGLDDHEFGEPDLMQASLTAEEPPADGGLPPDVIPTAADDVGLLSPPRGRSPSVREPMPVRPAYGLGRSPSVGSRSRSPRPGRALSSVGSFTGGRSPPRAIVPGHGVIVEPPTVSLGLSRPRPPRSLSRSASGERIARHPWHSTPMNPARPPVRGPGPATGDNRPAGSIADAPSGLSDRQLLESLYLGQNLVKGRLDIIDRDVAENRDRIANVSRSVGPSIEAATNNLETRLGARITLQRDALNTHTGFTAGELGRIQVAIASLQAQITALAQGGVVGAVPPPGVTGYTPGRAPAPPGGPAPPSGPLGPRVAGAGWGGAGGGLRE